MSNFKFPSYCHIPLNFVCYWSHAENDTSSHAIPFHLHCRRDLDNYMKAHSGPGSHAGHPACLVAPASPPEGSTCQRVLAAFWRWHKLIISNVSGWLLQGLYEGIINCKSFLLKEIPYFLKNRNLGLPWWCSGQESSCQCRGHGLDPWAGKIPQAVEQLSPCATTTEPAL